MVLAIYLFKQYFIQYDILNVIRRQAQHFLALSLHQGQNEQIEYLYSNITSILITHRL